MPESQELPNPTKPKAFSPSMLEADKTGIDKTFQKPKKGISKKQLAKRLLASAVIATGLGISVDDVPRGSLMEEPKGVHRELSEQDLEQRIEQSHQIKVISPQESKILTLSNGEQVKTEEWTREQLADLAGSLDKLPPHFYLPAPKIDRFYLPGRWFGGSNMTESKLQQLYEEAYMSDLKEHFGKDFKISKEELRRAISQKYFEKQEGVLPVSFILTDDLPSNRRFGVDEAGRNIKYYGATCYCGTSSENHEVLFSRDSLKRSQENKFRSTVHELTHRISSEDYYKFVLGLLEIPQGAEFGTSVLNNNFKLKNPEKIRYQTDVLKAYSMGEWVANAEFHYGATNPNEFVSVASEFYVGGKDIFMALYSIHIGEEKAGRFYDYMKDNIFRGTEYKDYQKIIK